MLLFYYIGIATVFLEPRLELQKAESMLLPIQRMQKYFYLTLFIVCRSIAILKVHQIKLQSLIFNQNFNAQYLYAATYTLQHMCTIFPSHVCFQQHACMQFQPAVATILQDKLKQQQNNYSSPINNNDIIMYSQLYMQCF